MRAFAAGILLLASALLFAADAPPLTVERLRLPDGKPAPEEIARYHEQVMAGRWAEASNAWQRLRARIEADEAVRGAWQQLAPTNRPAVLVFWRPCGDCTRGTCARCEGRKLCATCAGSGKCLTCQGAGGMSKNCPDCLCPGCKGGGRCGSCFGALWRQCRTCGGSGQGAQQRVTMTCSTCKGAGSLPSRIDGKPRTCPTCKGARSISRTVAGKCAVCGGNGQERCPACQATGVCAICRGAGRKVPCATCRSTGRVVEKCPDCNGGGRCSTCAGGGKCRTCRGSGDCPLCAGAQAVETMRLPVAPGWIPVAAGVVRIPPPEPGARVRPFRTDFKPGERHVLSDPSPPAAEADSGPVFGR